MMKSTNARRGGRPQPQARPATQGNSNGNKKRSRNQEKDDYYDDDEGDSDSSEDDEEKPSKKLNHNEDDDSSTDWSSNDDEGKTGENEENSEQEEDEIDPHVPLFQLIRERQQKQKSEVPLTDSVNKTKKLKKILHRSTDSGSESEEEGRKRKNGPAEMRSDRPVKRLRIDADNSKRKYIDPRFMDYTGDLSSKHHLTNYQFIEDIKQKELDTLTKKYKKLKNETMKQELKQEINKVKQQLNERKLSKTAMNKYENLINEEKEKQKTLGKKPFYFKNSLKKDLLNEERYQHLKKEKKLKKFMDRKNKKIAVKEKKSIPLNRHFRSNEGE